MNKHLRIALAMGALAFSAQAAAQVTFYENEGFQGRSFTAQQRQIRDLERFGFNDRASSAVVAGERWEVCDDIRYGGRCTILRPGRYPSLAALGLNNRISSARAVNANARVDEYRYAPAPVVSQVTFFEHESFNGRSFTSDRPVENFTTFGFNDRASSVEVVGQPWEVCDDSGYRGRCFVLRPGRYPSFQSMGLNDRISSSRAVDSNARIDESRYALGFAPAPVAGQDFRRRHQERLYEANVTSVRAVVGEPGQRCWIEKEQVSQARPGINVPGAVAGALIGGILGHQIGSGGGRDLATVGGAAAGGFVGANVNRNGGQQTQDVQRCERVASTTPTYWDVGYNFRGQDHRVQMTSQPGPTVTVNEQGEPRI